MINILTSISLEKTIQSSLQLDKDTGTKKGKRNTLEAVKQYIESFEGYQLISTTYKNNSTKLDIVCPTGHTFKVTYSSFQRGQRCLECSGKQERHTIGSVRASVESFGYQLRSTTYKNNETKLDIVCTEGHNYKAVYNSFRRGQRCPECAGLKKHTIEAVKQHIESFGYRLISTEYLNTREKLEIVCPVGHNYKVKYGTFKRGFRCAECNFISYRRTMQNGEEWKPYGRNSTADIAWRKAVLKRDGQICQACLSPSKKLHAHHIESYAKNIELRNDLTNGVTLCEPCHNAFHSQYGKTTATRQDLEEFTRSKCG